MALVVVGPCSMIRPSVVSCDQVHSISVGADSVRSRARRRVIAFISSAGVSAPYPVLLLMPSTLANGQAACYVFDRWPAHFRRLLTAVRARSLEHAKD